MFDLEWLKEGEMILVCEGLKLKVKKLLIKIEKKLGLTNLALRF